MGAARLVHSTCLKARVPCKEMRPTQSKSGRATVGFDISRKDFEGLAQQRVDDAAALLQAHRWSGAYYLSGYALECAFKACIAKSFKTETLPDKDFVLATYTHSLGKLAEQAKLKTALDSSRTKVRGNWALATNWAPDSRYRNYDSVTATEMVNAVSDPADGVFEWIKAHW